MQRRTRRMLSNWRRRLPFPRIKFCLICDQVREETRSKLSLLGFLGVSPDVDVFVADPSIGAIQLAFVFGGDGGIAGQYNILFQLFDVQQNTIMASVDPGPAPAIAKLRTNIVLNLLASFPHFGPYELRLLVDGKLHYTAEFKILKQP